MAVPVVATSTTALDDDTDNSVTITKPALVASGDVLYIVAAHDGTALSWAALSGWTKETELTATTAGTTVALYSRRADGSEGADFTLTVSTRFKNVVAMRVTGVDSGVTDLTHALNSLDDTGTGTAHTSAAVTTSAADCLILTAFVADNTGVDSMAAAGGETEIADIQNPGFNGMVLGVYRSDAAAAGTYDHDVTLSPSGAALASVTWAINAAAGGGGGGSSEGRRMMTLGVG